MTLIEAIKKGGKIRRPPYTRWLDPLSGMVLFKHDILAKDWESDVERSLNGLLVCHKQEDVDKMIFDMEALLK